MLADFYLLELYYEAPQTAQYYEDLSRRYGIEALRRAVAAGYLIGKRVGCGPDCGRQLFWLSEKGRSMARGLIH